MTQGEHNVTEWDIGSYSRQPDFLTRKHYKVAMSVHYRNQYPACMVFCILATSTVISGRVITCNSTHGSFIVLPHLENKLPTLYV